MGTFLQGLFFFITYESLHIMYSVYIILLYTPYTAYTSYYYIHHVIRIHHINIRHNTSYYYIPYIPQIYHIMYLHHILHIHHIISYIYHVLRIHHIIIYTWTYINKLAAPHSYILCVMEWSLLYKITLLYFMCDLLGTSNVHLFICDQVSPMLYCELVSYIFTSIPRFRAVTLELLNRIQNTLYSHVAYRYTHVLSTYTLLDILLSSLVKPMRLA